MMKHVCVGLVCVLVGLAIPGVAVGQGLDEFDYEDLSFRGIMLEGGYLFADNVENASSLAIRFDLGYLGPGFRLVPGISYWKSDFDSDEIAGLESRLSDLVLSQGGDPAGLSLGDIDRRDLTVSLDGHFVWSVPFGLLSFAGAGVSAHFLDGSGSVIDDTFVEDLLDSVQAGLNLHVGLEYPLHERFRIYASPKLEILDDLKFFELRVGAHIVWGGLAPGERRE